MLLGSVPLGQPRGVSKEGVSPVFLLPAACSAPGCVWLPVAPFHPLPLSQLRACPSAFQCYLACHKKCLETLAIQCGHKKLQGKLQLFGQDFMKASQSSSDGIPFIIKKCISEIEKRALKTKVTHPSSLSCSYAGSAASSRRELLSWHEDLRLRGCRLPAGQKVPL